MPLAVSMRRRRSSGRLASRARRSNGSQTSGGDDGRPLPSVGLDGLALGNVIGSNIANIGLVLGVAVLIAPARVDVALPRRELPVLVLSTATVPLVLLDGAVAPWEAIGLLVVAVTYTGWMIRAARSASSVARARRAATATGEATENAGAPRPVGPSPLRAAAIAGLGLLVLLIGGRLFVDGSVLVARARDE